MKLSLKNKNAIVCGSTQGIGEASAIELARLGANITLIARNESKLLDVLNELDKSQGQVHSFVCIDFLDTEKLKKEVELLKETYHILINNTGGPAAGPIADANTQPAVPTLPPVLKKGILFIFESFFEMLLLKVGLSTKGFHQ